MTVLKAPASTALTTAPRGLLLDFGGVVFQTAKHVDGRDRMAQWIVDLLGRAGQPVPFAHVRTSLDSALVALKHWKHSSSRRLAPREMGHREIVRDFIAADYPVAAREVLVAEASELLDVMNTTISSHTVRPGIPELLAEARQRGIGVGIVSNAHSGRSHRRLMAEHGLADFFDVQVYSDEVGVRKPNPRMIEIAADALGLEPAECWYVGDTLDRDVVVGRRAGIGAMVITRAQHTDSPPFGVVDEPDAVFDTPEGLWHALREAVDRPGTTPLEPSLDSHLGEGRPVLFIDHGGVISTAIKEPEPVAEFAASLARLLSAPGEELTAHEALQLVRGGRERYGEFKKAGLRDYSAGGETLVEIDPRSFWVDYVGVDLTPRQRAILRAEADALMVGYARVKSRRILRDGITELLTSCRERGVPVVVVSNTMSGRVVREECQRHGLTDLIGAYVCSDEVGVRKPDHRIVDAAVLLSEADPAQSWFFGDKPENDAAAALAVGIGRRVMVRGGSTSDTELAQALASRLATDVVDDAHDLLDLMRTVQVLA